MVAIVACECLGRKPHTHVPEKAACILDNGAGVSLDATHYEMNKGRIREVIAILPPKIEYWE